MKITSKNLIVYDLETYATGFADPSYVPQVITCIAWKKLGEPQTSTRVTAFDDFRDKDNPMGHLDPVAIRAMMELFLPDLDESDGVITYNGSRFDNPVLNGSYEYAGFHGDLGDIFTYDLHDFGKVKGLKKGLDNTAYRLGVLEEKLSLNHAQWQGRVGYQEPGLWTVKKRASSDVWLTEQVWWVRREMDRIRPGKWWRS